MTPEPSDRRVSIRDIAKLMGLSHATVSMALRDSPRVAAQSREKIRKFAEDIGYRPDPALVALASYRNNKANSSIQAAIAWINVWPRPEDLRAHKEFEGYWQGASKCAAKFGYRLEEFRLGSELTAQRLHQILEARGIRGLLLTPHAHPVDWGDFPFEQYSMVRFGRAFEVPRCHLVTADQAANAILAFEQMYRHGYRRIGFVTDESELTQDRHHFERGFHVAQRRFPDVEPIPIFVLHNYPEAERQKTLMQWVKQYRPDAIFTNRSETRVLLEAAGVQIPGDIAMAASTILDTNVDAGIDQHPEEVGRVAFLTLNSQINDGAKGIPLVFRQVLVEGSWVDGASLPGIER